jgi:hypothetical protein
MLSSGEIEHFTQIPIKLFICKHLKHLKKKSIWEMYDNFLS